jgi:hypothetical protein
MFKVHLILPSGVPILAFLVPLLPLHGVYGGRTTRMGVNTPATVTFQRCPLLIGCETIQEVSKVITEMPPSF